MPGSSEARATAWLDGFFAAPLFDAKCCLTTDPAAVSLARSDHPLLPIVALRHGERVPPNGLLLAPLHLPRFWSSPTLGGPALARVAELAARMRAALAAAYGAEAGELRHVIWAGVGGSIEDKHLSMATGLMDEAASVQVWCLDDVNRDSLAHVLRAIASDAVARGAAPEAALGSGLRTTVVVAQALGLMSYEPAFNVRHALAPLFEAHTLAVATHCVKMTLPGSILDSSLGPAVLTLPHQPDGRHTAAGRHDYVTHGLMLALALAGAPFAAYAGALELGAPHAACALGLADWIFSAGAVEEACARKEAVVLKLPASWNGRWVSRGGLCEWRDGSLWFKQCVEESLGKSPARLLKVVTAAAAPTAPARQLVLLVRDAGAGADADAASAAEAAALIAQGYDVRVHALPAGASTARAQAELCGTFTLLALRLAQLWGVCAVDQPPVDSYKRIVTRLHTEPVTAGACAAQPAASPPSAGIAEPLPGAGIAAALVARSGAHTAAGERGLSISYHAAAVGGGLAPAAIDAELCRLGLDGGSAADVLGAIHRVARASTAPRACYGEVIYFGNLSRGAEARALRHVLDEHFARAIWADAARSFADVGKGPAIGHSTHAMGMQGGVLTLSILPDGPEADSPPLHGLDFPDAYQASHCYANVLALSGFDLATAADALVPGGGHPGMVVLVRIARNDAHSRDVLASLFARVAEIVRMP